MYILLAGDTNQAVFHRVQRAGIFIRIPAHLFSTSIFDGHVFKERKSLTHVPNIIQTAGKSQDNFLEQNPAQESRNPNPGTNTESRIQGRNFEIWTFSNFQQTRQPETKCKRSKNSRTAKGSRRTATKLFTWHIISVGGSMWEIQHILDELFDNPIDQVLALYKKKMRGIIAYYVMLDKNKKELLRLVNRKEVLAAEDPDLEGLPIEAPEKKELLRDMVRNNILYFDPTEATYYPQGKSYQWGIRLFFDPSAPRRGA
jgi:hypothetical protein